MFPANLARYYVILYNMETMRSTIGAEIALKTVLRQREIPHEEVNTEMTSILALSLKFI